VSGYRSPMPGHLVSSRYRSSRPGPVSRYRPPIPGDPVSRYRSSFPGPVSGSPMPGHPVSRYRSSLPGPVSGYRSPMPGHPILSGYLLTRNVSLSPAYTRARQHPCYRNIYVAGNFVGDP
jgi:hypothetical protein